MLIQLSAVILSSWRYARNDGNQRLASVQVTLLPPDGRNLAAATTTGNKIACKQFNKICSFGRQFRQFCVLFVTVADLSPAFLRKTPYGFIGIYPLAIAIAGSPERWDTSQWAR